MKFGLSQSEYKLIQLLVIEPLARYQAQVWIFGSRARGDFKPFSDLS